MSRKKAHLKGILDRLYAKYNRKGFIDTDPLQFVYRYSNRRDMEIAGFVAAVLAYGRVEQIKKDVEDLLGRMGDSPFAFVKNFDNEKRAKLKGFKHRFTSSKDIADLFSVLSAVAGEYGSIEKAFAAGYNPRDGNIGRALTEFCELLLKAHAKRHGGHVSQGLRYLLPRPAAGSACKRLNLFLRWMVREDGVDAGLWNGVDKAKLVVPVDVHMDRLCRILGLCTRKTVSWAAAEEITSGFAGLKPSDPVRYDFALSRVGIIEGCNGKYELRCDGCELEEFCK